MSASNWDICPVCRCKAIIAKDESIRKTNEAYGKVSSDKYQNMLTEANKPIDLELTLREDYEIGIDEKGSFFVIYHGHCQQCAFGFDFLHDKKLTEIIRDRCCCECCENYTCDLLDPKDDPVWCPKCRVTEAPGPKLKNY